MFLQCLFLLQQVDKTLHQVFTGSTHVSLEGLFGTMARKGHDVVDGVSAFVQIGDSASSGGMETYHLPLGKALDVGGSTPVLFGMNNFVDAATFGQFLDGFVGFCGTECRESVCLIMGYDSSYLFQDRKLHPFFGLGLIKRDDSVLYVSLVQSLHIADS